MKKRIFSSLLIFSILVSTVIFGSPVLSAKENNEVANLALMLPDSDIILAVDMDKTLNVVGPSLLNQDGKKIENLRKLMKSLENVVGLNPYEIKQIVAGIKVPSAEEKSFFEQIDFTVIFRTVRSNDNLLEDWSKKMDAIEAFNSEKEPTEKYMDALKAFRYYNLGKDETEKITKLSKEFEEINQKINEVKMQMTKLPGLASSNKLVRDSLKKSSNVQNSIIRFKSILLNDSDVKNLREASVKLQNRWYEVSLEDPKRGEKLNQILKEAKEIYPNYKVKAGNVAKIDALINLSNYQFYEELGKKTFGIPTAVDYEKSPNDLMKEKLDETIKTLANFSKSKPKQNNQLKLISGNLQKLEDAMNIRLKEADNAGKFDYLNPEEFTQTKSNRSLSKTIKDNAKISEVNGKRLITMDFEKISFWNSGLEEVEVEAESKTEIKIATTPAKAEPVKPETPAEDKKEDNSKKEEAKKEEAKRELFAIGYLDEKTMVLGFESGIRSILSRKEDYKNPKAAEMINSFKNPLITFATNSKIFEGFTKIFDSVGAKKEEKKETPTDKFFKDLNIFGSIEYDNDGAASNDLIMSLGFTKNRVEEVFSIEADEESSVFELGDYQISKAIFYDLINTLKAFKASVSLKFEKKKVASLIESAPQIIEEIRFQNRQPKTERAAKTRIQSFQNIEDLLISPKFYADLAQAMSKRKKK